MSFFYVFIGVMLITGAALGLSIVFNGVTINVLERRRKYAVMRAVGMSRGGIGVILALGVKRTTLRPKPESEKLTFNVHPLTTEELWQRANENLRERGRGRGKQGKKIQALFRGRMIYPLCGKPIAVMRRRNGRIYYGCRPRYSRWLKNPCPCNNFVPGKWYTQIWHEIYGLFNNDEWIEQQLAVELDSSREIEKLIQLQEHKINTYQGKIMKAEEGFEDGLYTLGEARLRKQKSLEAIDREADQWESRLDRLYDFVETKAIEPVRMAKRIAEVQDKVNEMRKARF